MFLLCPKKDIKQVLTRQKFGRLSSFPRVSISAYDYDNGLKLINLLLINQLTIYLCTFQANGSTENDHMYEIHLKQENNKVSVSRAYIRYYCNTYTHLN